MGWRGSKVSQICAPGKDRQQVADKAKALPRPSVRFSAGPAGGEGLQPAPPTTFPCRSGSCSGSRQDFCPPGLLPVRVRLLGVGHGVLGHLRPQMLRCQHLWGYKVPLPRRPGDTLQRPEAWPSWECRLQ